MYLRRSYVVECAVAAHVAALSAPSPSTGAGLHAAELAAVEARLSFALAPGQRVALERLVGARIGVLTGGPGTGKTTIVRAVVAAAAQRRLSVALAAPTGRAAKRLSESTGDDARTLHRLLSFDPRTGQFGRDGDTPLECDLVIVDEASMLDQELALALLSALSPATSLLLVGDVEQLPSVGAGEVLADLIRSECVAVARLDRVFRQAAESQILDCAHAIRGGEVPTPSVGPRGEYFFIEARDPGHAVQAVCRVVTARLPAAFGLDPVADVQVLAPMHGGALGTQVLNAALQEAIHGERPSGPALVRGTRRVGVGDKVMQIRNNYDLEVFNGDIGVVTGVDVDALTLDVRFDEREVRYGREQIDDLVLAYAVSVHKSQGSEFRAVVLVLTTHHFKLLQRNLLYTAVTRARERLVIVGTQRALRMAIDDAAQERRYTRLAARIGRAAYEAPTTETAT